MLWLVLCCALARPAQGGQDHLAKAEELFGREDYAAAVRVLTQLSKAQPQSARALALLGASFSKLGRYGEAERALGGSLRLAPDHPEVLKQLGWVYYQTGRLEEADKALGRSLQLNPSDPEAHYALGVVKHAGHDYVSAAGLAQRALTLNTGDLPSELLLAQCLVDMQQYENADWTYRAALRLNEKLATPSEKPYVLYGQLLFVLNRLDEARRMFSRALDLDSRSAAARLGRARVFEEQEQHGAALADAEAALALAPENEVLHTLLLRIYISTGDEGKARGEARWLEDRNKARLAGPGGAAPVPRK